MAAAYAEHPLAASAVFAAAWCVRAGAEPEAHRVLPDGEIDVILRPGRPPEVAGPATRPALVALRPGEVVRGLRLRPGAAGAALGVAAHELRDLHVPLADLPRARRAHGPDPLVAAAVAALRRHPGLEVAALARELAISERQLRRRFHDAVGYGPRRLGRLLRLQRLLEAGRRDPAAGGAALAAAAGYADQPHMIREVRALAGTSPGALLAERGRFLQATDGPLAQTA